MADQGERPTKYPKRPWSKWYSLKAWRLRRAAQLSAEPNCRACAQDGRTRPATVADHITPHRGDPELFWRGKLQSLCKVCHDAWKQRLELQGYDHAPSVDTGWPDDPRHPFNTGAPVRVRGHSKGFSNGKSSRKN